MTDCFAVLDEPRQPVLDLESLKARFLARSAKLHPDRQHNAGETERLAATERYAALNHAYIILQDTGKRLGHLLELELGRKPSGIETVPPEWMEGSMEVGQLCRSVDAFLAAQTSISSPLLKVQGFQKAMQWKEVVDALTRRMTARLEGLLGELRAINPAWEAAPPIGDSTRAASLPLEELTRIFRCVSFVSRWIAQLQDRAVKLMI